MPYIPFPPCPGRRSLPLIASLSLSLSLSLSCTGRTDGEIPDADVVTDDAAADPAAEGEDGEVCEVKIVTFSPVFIFLSAHWRPA